MRALCTSGRPVVEAVARPSGSARGCSGRRPGPTAAQAHSNLRPDPVAERRATANTAGPRPVVNDARPRPSASATASPPTTAAPPAAGESLADTVRRRARERKREQTTYRAAAIAASVGVTSLAIAAVHARFAWARPDGGDVPASEAVATMLLVLGGVVGMEIYARWAHKALWHDLPAGWALHKSHHEPRVGPFEANDVFAVMNAAPAMALCAYGFLTPSLAGGLAFGAGLGITLFGMSYMFVHDGLVHRRFPVGPIADVPALQRIAAAHKLHHSEKYGGVPFGLFLGPQELEAIGAGDDLDKLCEEMAAARSKATGKQ